MRLIENFHRFENKIRPCYGSVQFWFCILLICIIVSLTNAEVNLPSVISSGMVLQQNKSAAIWGWAGPCEKIVVIPGWSKEQYKTETDSDGKWIVKINTPSAGGPYTITIKGDNQIVLNDILIGEVWLCSGQSNMEFSTAKLNQWQPGVANYERELADSDYPQIRLFKISRNASAEIQQDCQGVWNRCEKETVAPFSAVGYFFGKNLHKQLDIPIGLIESAYGGTPSQGWTDMKYMRSHKAFDSLLSDYDKACDRYPRALKDWKKRVQQWEKDTKQAKAKGKTPSPKPWKPMGPGNPHAPASLFNGMIAPILPYTIQGVIWYQGEANAKRAFEYSQIFPAMIQNWRIEWGNRNMPFYYVQIAPWNYKDPFIAAELRESQLLTMYLPNTGMVVTTDLVDDINNIHPNNKQDVGKRLALWALAKTYNKPDIVCSGPLYRSFKIEGDKIRLFFDYAGGGLVAKGDKLTHFEIAENDGKFVPAQAVIEGETLLVYNSSIKKPKYVRFGWSNKAEPNFFNKQNLPASPFRTDKLPLVTQK